MGGSKIWQGSTNQQNTGHLKAGDGDLLPITEPALLRL